MIQFDPVLIGDYTYQMTEITFNASLKVTVIDKSLNEKRMTAFLSSILNVDPLAITVQERYFLMLKYMQKQGQTLFSNDLDFSKYMVGDCAFAKEIHENGITVRQLTGRDAELLETNCKSAAEWIACMMAMQLSYEGHSLLEHLPDQSADQQVYSQQFMSRLDHIKNLSASDFEQCYDDFSRLNQQLFTHICVMVSNEGLVLRGADDAPLRFRPSACFIGIIKQLDQSYSHQSQ